MLNEMRERLKARVGIYGTGWDPESVMGLLLPVLTVAMLVLVGFFFVKILHGF
jgi:hypothetical protein